MNDVVEKNPSQRPLWNSADCPERMKMLGGMVASATICSLVTSEASKSPVTSQLRCAPLCIQPEATRPLEDGSAKAGMQRRRAFTDGPYERNGLIARPLAPGSIRVLEMLGAVRLDYLDQAPVKRYLSWGRGAFQVSFLIPKTLLAQRSLWQCLQPCEFLYCGQLCQQYLD